MQYLLSLKFCLSPFPPYFPIHAPHVSHLTINILDNNALRNYTNSIYRLGGDGRGRDCSQIRENTNVTRFVDPGSRKENGYADG